MKIEKLSLKGVKNVLSKTEMKNIMAGSSRMGYYQCCWDSIPNSCSACVAGTGQFVCQPGSHIVVC